MDAALVEWLGSVSNDPLAYVMGAFEWGKPGTRLEGMEGPEPWQRDVLCLIRDRLASGMDRAASVQYAIQIAVASGHGVGKSALVSWIIKWGMDTLPDSRGVCTANTETQLKSKTWAELGKWHSLSITKDIFKLTATAYFQPEHERTWRMDMVAWSERNTEAFAGMHNQGRRIIFIMDEASAIIDQIWEVAEGALTDADTQIIWCAFGNPTRNSGRFKECFAGGQFAKYWDHRQVDSRTVSFTNKDQIARWVEAYGADSDFVRIRILGVFPRHGEMEFFKADEVREAMLREATSDMYAPLALGVDVARFGSNNSVIYPRKGRDARSIPRQVFNGLDTVTLSDRVFDAFNTYHADGIFIDGGGVGGGVVDICRNKHLFVYDVQFGGKATGAGYTAGIEGERYANKRAEMYGSLRAWLRVGAIPNEPELERQLMAITYTFNLRDEIQLTSKEQMMKDGHLSPDDVDGLALTFAHPLARHERAGGDHPHKPLVESEYDPYSVERMVT